MEKLVPEVRYYANENGPVIGVTTRGVIERDGLFFKDISGDGRFAPYADWRLCPAERAAALVKELTPEEKIGLIFIDQKNMGLLQQDKSKVDASGLLDEEIVEKGESIFTVEKAYGTTYSIKEMHLRHFIFRQDPKPSDLVNWVNKLNEVAEGCRVYIPVLLASNSRNEMGRRVFGMNDAGDRFPTWPGTMGLASAMKGAGPELIDRFSECIRKVWDACGLKKGYMYMADPLTDPRWQRSFGTFGEDEKLISEIMERMIPIIQGENGVEADGVAMTIKHFPGGGARENGFDPHYKEGQWNVYATPGSLERYHLPPFQTAIDKKAASIMPYYAKPSNERSAPQLGRDGKPLVFREVGFAYNDYFIRQLLREQMGFEGYVNSDSGITHKMCWGVEELDTVERVALAINNGVDIISGSHAVWDGLEAYRRGKEDYYGKGGHKVPEKYTAEQMVLSDEALDTAAVRTLTEMFELGLFENPYRDPAEADAVTATKAYWEEAYRTHQKSAVLVKNRANTLPLKAESLRSGKLYLACFDQDEAAAVKETERLKALLGERYGISFAESPAEADTAVFFLTPNSGAYFSATKGFLEIDICEDKTVPTVDENGCPTEQTQQETTLKQLGSFREAAEKVRARGGKVVVSVNVTLPWMLGNVEPLADALVLGFDTFREAIFDVMAGSVKPVGRMPVTLPKSDAVIEVNKEGRCVSPNDVPGYDKDLYMPERLKDENGKAYAYRDSEGNYYELNFGLTYEA